MTGAPDTDRIRGAVAAALARRPLPPRSPAWLEESIIERARLLASTIDSANEHEARRAAEFAAELVVFASSQRPQGKRRLERRNEATLLAERAISEHPDSHRLNHRERELTRHLAALGALRHLRQYPRGTHGAEAIARRVVDVAMGIVIPAHSEEPADIGRRFHDDPA